MKFKGSLVSLRNFYGGHMNLLFRKATPHDLKSLLVLEEQCFTYDRLTARSFRWMISRAHASLIVAQAGGQLMGYCLVLFRRGTSLARLYSIAIASHSRGLGLGKQLLDQAQESARAHECTCLRLEVRPDNPVALSLYERNGYRRFAVVPDYYEDHVHALRLEKRILHSRESR